MRFACWITKATDTHSEYVMLIAFPRQQLLRERSSFLRYTYIASHFSTGARCTCLLLGHFTFWKGPFPPEWYFKYPARVAAPSGTQTPAPGPIASQCSNLPITAHVQTPSLYLTSKMCFPLVKQPVVMRSVSLNPDIRHGSNLAVRAVRSGHCQTTYIVHSSVTSVGNQTQSVPLDTCRLNAV
jgi:hypothetical protein